MITEWNLTPELGNDRFVPVIPESAMEIDWYEKEQADAE